MSTHLSDEEATRLAQDVQKNSDEGSFSELYTGTYALVYSVVAKVLPNPEDVHDCASEIFLKLWRDRMRQYDPTQRFQTWICQVSRNRAIDYVRSYKRRTNLYERHREEIEVHEGTAEMNDQPLANVYHEVDSGVRRAEGSEFIAAVETALEELPEDVADTIRLHLIEGETQSYIAEIRNEPIGTIKARIRRGKATLRYLLNDVAPEKYQVPDDLGILP